mgnify:FL=1
MSKVDKLLKDYSLKSNIIFEQDPPVDPAAAAPPPAAAAAPVDPAAVDPATGPEPIKLTSPGYTSMVVEMIKLLRLDPEAQISRDMKWLEPQTQNQIALKDISEEHISEKTAHDIHKLISKLLEREPYTFTED